MAALLYAPYVREGSIKRDADADVRWAMMQSAPSGERATSYGHLHG